MVSVFFIVLQTAEIFLYSFHISMIILLFLKQNTIFKGPFYNIFRVVIVADLLTYFTIIANSRLSMISEFSNFYISNTIFPTFLFNFAAYFVSLQFLGHTFMALNRFTFIWFPLKYPTIWKKHWYTFLLFLLPIFTILWKITELSIFKFLPDGNISLGLVNSQVSQIYFTLSTTIYITTTCISAGLNFLSFIKFYFYKQTNSSLHINEKSLLIVSMIVFVAQVWRTSYNISRLYFSTNEVITSFYATILPVIYDAVALSGTVSLLILSKTTRKEYLSFYLRKKYFKTHLITSNAHISTLNK